MTALSAKPRALAAEVHLVNGQIVDGTLESFAPSQSSIALQVGGTTRLEATENIAWIAFGRDARLAPPAVGAETFRVHVAGGQVLHVRARADEVPSDVGFFAYPVQADDPKGEIFVFAHAMNACERDVPLGAMLVAEGVLDADSVERGVNAQATGRRQPIGQILVEMRKVDPASVDQAVQTQGIQKARLGDVLVEAGFASQADIDLAVAEQKRRQGKRLGEVLVEIGILSEQDLGRALAAKFQIPLVNLEEVAINPAAQREVPREIMSKYGVLPIDVDPKVLTVAIDDPLATDAIDMLRFQSRRRIQVVLVTHAQLRRAVDEALRASKGAATSPPSPAPSPGNPRVAVRSAPADIAQDASKDPDGVIRIVNQLVLSAAQRGASDVHIEPLGDGPVRVRLRIDGRCLAAPDIPARFRSALTVRLKVMANLDIAERRRPQDGKIRLATTDGKSIDVRVTTIPTIDDNEDVVLRILTGSRAVTFEDLLLSDKNAEAIRSWLQLDHGLLLCVGPTGVGKTTTVHGMLSLLDTSALKVWTAEDPVEIVGPGLRQVHVQPKIDLTFAAALRTFLRADPDVIMIGEMRDLETASLAVEASLTGHLVLSTLHTKSAPDTIARLLDMGIEPFTVADALSGVVSQRLVRKLCEVCKTSELAGDDELSSLERFFGAAVVARAREAFGGSLRVWRPSACEACGQTGYNGRIAIHEVLTVDDSLRPMIARRASADELRRAAGEQMVSLREDGLHKALAGLTDLREVLAITS